MRVSTRAASSAPACAPPQVRHGWLRNLRPGDCSLDGPLLMDWHKSQRRETSELIWHELGYRLLRRRARGEAKTQNRGQQARHLHTETLLSTMVTVGSNSGRNSPRVHRSVENSGCDLGPPLDTHVKISKAPFLQRALKLPRYRHSQTADAARLHARPLQKERSGRTRSPHGFDRPHSNPTPSPPTKAVCITVRTRSGAASPVRDWHTCRSKSDPIAKTKLHSSSLGSHLNASNEQRVPWSINVITGRAMSPDPMDAF